MMLPTPAFAAVTTVNLIEALDYYDDDILKLGDGFTSFPLDYDNDAGVRDYQDFFSGTFVLDSLASDNRFSISTTATKIDYPGHYFTFNDNPVDFSLEMDESELLFSDFFVAGENTITFYINGSGSNLDDFEISQFDLTYAVETSGPGEVSQEPVPESASIALFGFGLMGLAAWRKK